MRQGRAVAVGALLLAVVIAGARAWFTKRQAPRRSLPNVVFIVLDTVRVDRLGVYNPASHLTPFLDQLATQGLVYDRAYAAGSWTVPSVASMFVAQYASEHQVVVLNAILPEDSVTL